MCRSRVENGGARWLTIVSAIVNTIVNALPSQLCSGDLEQGEVSKMLAISTSLRVAPRRSILMP